MERLSEGLHEIRFSPNQKLPPGYRVVWDDTDESMCYWYINDDLYGLSSWDRWYAYRSAWLHYRSTT